MTELQHRLRIAAALSVAGVLVWRSATTPIGWPLVVSVLLLSVFAAAVFFVLFRLAPDGWRQLERHPDVLVPAGLYLGALALLDWTGSVSTGLSHKLFTLPLYFTAVDISVLLLLRGLLRVLFVLWTTWLVVQVVRTDGIDLPRVGAAWLPRYGRFLLLLLLGWAVSTLLMCAEISLLLAVGMPLGSLLGQFGILVFLPLMVAILAFHFWLNLLTAMVLLIAADENRGSGPSLGRGIGAARRHRRQWWKLVLAQYVLMGVWLTLTYQYTHTGNSTNFKLNFNYDAPWLADYSQSIDWYSRLLGWIGQGSLDVVAEMWGLLSLLMAIVIKLTIFDRYAVAQAGPALSETIYVPREEAEASVLP